MGARPPLREILDPPLLLCDFPVATFIFTNIEKSIVKAELNHFKQRFVPKMKLY